MNEIKCIFCEIESDLVVIEENGYKGKKCPQCGLIYVSPRPSFNEIVDLYGHNEAHISAESHIYAGFSKRIQARHHLKIVRSFVKSGALLEIGAGAGYFLDEARKIGFRPHGLEFNPIQADYIRNQLRLPCEESPLHPSLFEGKQFDVVYHCDVISHLFDPISDFKIINAMMHDKSFLIFETGNLAEVDQTYFKYIQRFQYPDHLFFFSPDNIVDLLGRTGFELITMYRYSILPQLKVMKALSGIKNSIQKHVFESSEKEKHPFEHKGGDQKLVAHSKSFNAKSILKKSIKNSSQYVNYVLRYKIGRIAPKAHRPQTVIVVARKKTQV